MREHAEDKGVKAGEIMTMPWPTRANFIGGCRGWQSNPRTVKVLVLDLTGEFTKIADRLANQTLYRGFDSTILNQNTKRKKSFTQRNLDLYISKV